MLDSGSVDALAPAAGDRGADHHAHPCRGRLKWEAKDLPLPQRKPHKWG